MLVERLEKRLFESSERWNEVEESLELPVGFSASLIKQSPRLTPIRQWLYTMHALVQAWPLTPPPDSLQSQSLLKIPRQTCVGEMSDLHSLPCVRFHVSTVSSGLRLQGFPRITTHQLCLFIITKARAISVYSAAVEYQELVWGNQGGSWSSLDAGANIEVAVLR